VHPLGWSLAGVPVTYHEESDQVHCWCCLALPDLLQKSTVLTDYVAGVASQQ